MRCSVVKRFWLAGALVIALIAGFFLGCCVVRNNNSLEELRYPQVCYAEITKIDETTIHAERLEINDINNRGPCRWGKVRDEYRIEWRHMEQPIDSLKVGQTVAVFYKGLAEVDPPRILDVLLIRILDDEI